MVNRCSWVDWRRGAEMAEMEIFKALMWLAGAGTFS